MNSFKVAFCGAVILCADQVQQNWGWHGIAVAIGAVAAAYLLNRAFRKSNQ